MTIQPRTIRSATPWAVLAALVFASCGGDDAPNDPVPEPARTTQPDTTMPDTTQPDTTQPATTTVPDTTMPDTTMPDTTMPDTTMPDTTMPDTTQPVDHPPVVAHAIDDLAERTGRSESEITVARYGRVTWSDGSIGCPQPGMSYTQALVPGFRIELVVDGASYWYHGARDGDPFWCATPNDPVEGGAGDT